MKRDDLVEHVTGNLYGNFAGEDMAEWRLEAAVAVDAVLEWLAIEAEQGTSDPGVYEYRDSDRNDGEPDGVFHNTTSNWIRSFKEVTA